MADLTALAQKIRSINSPASASSTSLIPSAQATDFSELLPSRPSYSPYSRQEFDPTVSGGPGSDLGWTWTKGVRSKQLFDQEQDAKANDALQAYQFDLGAWQDAVNLAEMNYKAKQDALGLQNDQLISQGLVPSMSLNDPSARLRELGLLWNEATDQATKDYIHNQAESLRQSAGWGAGGLDGSLTASRMSMAGSPNAETTASAASAQYKQAFDRWTTLGYVANDSDATVLGVPKGTMTDDAAYRAASLAARGSGSGGGGTTATKTANTASRMKEVGTKIYNGSDPKAVEAQILSPAVYSNLLEEGVDPAKLIDHAYMVKYGMSKAQYDTAVNGTPATQNEDGTFNPMARLNSGG